MGKRLYCNRWNRYKRIPGGSISEDEARRRFELREPFCAVVLDDQEQPTGFVEIGGKSFEAGFLDAALRLALSFGFVDVGGRLFLSQVIEFKEAPDGTVEKLHVLFKQDGTGTAIQSHGRHATKSELRPGHVSKNWEPLPDFDSIAGLLRRDR